MTKKGIELISCMRMTKNDMKDEQSDDKRQRRRRSAYQLRKDNKLRIDMKRILRRKRKIFVLRSPSFMIQRQITNSTDSECRRRMSSQRIVRTKWKVLWDPPTEKIRVIYSKSTRHSSKVARRKIQNKENAYGYVVIIKTSWKWNFEEQKYCISFWILQLYFQNTSCTKERLYARWIKTQL